MTTQAKASGTKPTHHVFHVTGEGKSARWIEIGAAWANRDGNGFSITCETLPVSGRMVMRKITEKPKKAAAE